MHRKELRKLSHGSKKKLRSVSKLVIGGLMFGVGDNSELLSFSESHAQKIVKKKKPKKEKKRKNCEVLVSFWGLMSNNLSHRAMTFQEVSS